MTKTVAEQLWDLERDVKMFIGGEPSHRGCDTDLGRDLYSVWNSKMSKIEIYEKALTEINERGGRSGEIADIALGQGAGL